MERPLQWWLVGTLVDGTEPGSSGGKFFLVQLVGSKIKGVAFLLSI